MAELLRAAPPDASLLRAHGGSAARPLTYGRLLQFISGAGDLRRAGISHHSQVVVYAVPPGPAGAAALLAISAQCSAAPLDPNSKQADAADALRQLRPSAVLAFRGVACPGLEAAAKEAGLPICWQVSV